MVLRIHIGPESMDSEATSKGNEAVSDVIAGVGQLAIVDDYHMDEEYLNDAVDKLFKSLGDNHMDEEFFKAAVELFKVPTLDHNTDEGHPNGAVDKSFKSQDDYHLDEESFNTAVEELSKLPALDYDTDKGHPNDAADRLFKLSTHEKHLNAAVDKLCKGVMDYISTDAAAYEPCHIKKSRLDPEGSWSSRKKFQAFSGRYKSRFNKFVKEYSRVGIYPKKDVKINYFDLPYPMRANEDVLKEYRNFKRFDFVDDFPDHLFLTKHIEQPENVFAERMHEWETLKEKLPETIFLRACRSKVDLLRAVIIGPKGTPYHDGLFFFDMYIPSSYPNEPPLVRYHSTGYRINPHLFECGEFRLNLVRPGDDAILEPSFTTVLDILIFIKDRVLNADPLFCQPGFLDSGPPLIAEYFSLLYNENILLKSLHTMRYMIVRPPKKFEAFVVGHFSNRAHHILNACKAYIRGMQAGRFDGNKKMCRSIKFRSDVIWVLRHVTVSFEDIEAIEAPTSDEEAFNAVKSAQVKRARLSEVLPRQLNSPDSSIVNEPPRSRKTTRKLRKKSIGSANPLTILRTTKNFSKKLQRAP